MTYFHTGIRTIIGAESFHCPVRDGKEWDQLAMVIRLNWLVACSFDEQETQFVESCSIQAFQRALHVESALILIAFKCSIE